MIAALSNTDRDVVPRWRTLAGTVSAGEIVRSDIEMSLGEREQREMDDRLADFRARPSETTASDLVGTALAVGRPADATEAAELLADSDSSLLRSMADAVMKRRIAQESLALMEPSASKEVLHRLVASSKARLTVDPRNAIIWTEMSRNYTILGQIDAAERAIRIALRLAPSNRYVVRAAVCFFVGKGQPDIAHAVVVRAESAARDPWLAAAEIAAAEVAERRPQLVSNAKAMVDSADFHPRDLSELAGELATLELRAGSDKRARRLFDSSLADPTENAVAQAQWASEQSARIGRPPGLDLPHAAEARTILTLWQGEWAEAIDNSVAWLSDQPFSREAAVAGSYAASVGTEDWEAGVHFASRGLQAHPRDPLLVNNLAFAKANLGELDTAARVLETVNLTTASSGEMAALKATRGLIAFRLGRADEGRSHYREAIALARMHRLQRHEAIAMIMLALEEIRSGDAEGEVLSGALRLSKRNPDSGTTALAKRLEKALTHKSE